MWTYTYTSPYFIMAWCLIKHKDNFIFIGFEIITAAAMKSTFFWDITSSSPVDVRGRFRGTHCLHLLGSKSKHIKKPESNRLQSSALKMEPVPSSETSEIFCRTTRPYIAEVSNFTSHLP
jgi:hypothetical protein